MTEHKMKNPIFRMIQSCLAGIVAGTILVICFEIREVTLGWIACISFIILNAMNNDRT